MAEEAALNQMRAAEAADSGQAACDACRGRATDQAGRNAGAGAIQQPAAGAIALQRVARWG